eukprot:821860-Amphidinium_carterae.1
MATRADIKACRSATAWEFVILRSTALQQVGLHRWTRVGCGCHGDGTSTPVFVFTNGCCEGSSYRTVGIGGMLFADGLERPEFFHALTEAVLIRWRSTGVRQVIYPAEVFLILIAKKVWAQRLAHRDVIFIVNNEGASSQR